VRRCQKQVLFSNQILVMITCLIKLQVNKTSVINKIIKITINPAKILNFRKSPSKHLMNNNSIRVQECSNKPFKLKHSMDSYLNMTTINIPTKPLTNHRISKSMLKATPHILNFLKIWWKTSWNLPLVKTKMLIIWTKSLSIRCNYLTKMESTACCNKQSFKCMKLGLLSLIQSLWFAMAIIVNWTHKSTESYWTAFPITLIREQKNCAIAFMLRLYFRTSFMGLYRSQILKKAKNSMKTTIS